jgi:hypothetical protein
MTTLLLKVLPDPMAKLDIRTIIVISSSNAFGFWVSDLHYSLRRNNRCHLLIEVNEICSLKLDTFSILAPLGTPKSELLQLLCSSPKF